MVCVMRKGWKRARNNPVILLSRFSTQIFLINILELGYWSKRASTIYVDDYIYVIILVVVLSTEFRGYTSFISFNSKNSKKIL